ncbi:response regulator [Sulfitobacter sabulilitoris]|uniref:Response regulator n=1 Tax=Sulfitobacter sabulilitoris TaxID=2562655 RepID=A0A5S3PJQ0_9RHOB|nr:response regulator [Sulfitobacter sabulilitoris]TMM54638.1 response regulator [Sulfitobacter sabulilitoris]
MKILAVDDDPIILELLNEVLGSTGYPDVTTVETGADALAAVEDHRQPFDCILLDIQMPGMDGIELCGRLRAMPRYRETPVLMLTAMSEKHYIDRAFRAGATDYVTKPFDIVELGARLRVAQSLSDGQKRLSDKVFSAKAVRQKALAEDKIRVEEAYPVKDVDGVIPMPSMYNYLAQLGRSSLFGSSVIAFKINDIERLHGSMSGFEYTCMITDVAEAIITSLPFMQSLLSYAGNGVFICIASGAHSVSPEVVLSQVDHALNMMELSYNDGRPMTVTLRISAPTRLTFRAGDGTKRAIMQAITNVEISPAADSKAAGGYDSGRGAMSHLAG